MYTPEPSEAAPLSALDFHLLVALAQAGELYGYALMKAVAAQSGGRLTPEIGSLYRVLARLMEQGWVDEADAPEHAAEVHPGKPRRYYRLTEVGRRVATGEAARLREVLEVAVAADLLPEGGA